MSVHKSQQTPSNQQFVKTARELELYTIKKCVGFPKRYTFYVSERLANLASTVYEECVKANSIFPTKQWEYKLRRKHLVEARASARALVAKIESAAELFDIDYEKIEYWMGFVDEEIRLLNGLLESDASRFKNLPE